MSEKMCVFSEEKYYFMLFSHELCEIAPAICYNVMKCGW